MAVTNTELMAVIKRIEGKVDGLNTEVSSLKAQVTTLNAEIASRDAEADALAEALAAVEVKITPSE
jgi:peptidoglycan hydrolase CwlO-like protein